MGLDLCGVGSFGYLRGSIWQLLTLEWQIGDEGNRWLRNARHVLSQCESQTNASFSISGSISHRVVTCVALRTLLFLGNSLVAAAVRLYF